MATILPTTSIKLNDAKPKSLNSEKQKLGDLEKEKLRLKKAAHEFESFFMSSMLKSMRQTIPKSEQKNGVGDSGLGKEIYQSMFDEELSQKMADGSRGGLADILYKNLVNRIEIKYPAQIQADSKGNAKVIESSKLDSHRIDSTQTDSLKADSFKTDSLKTDSIKTEALKTEPSKGS